MKNLLENLSVTKLVFLILTLVLSFVTVWNTLKWLDNKIFETIISMTFAFYFWQKWLKYDDVDSMVKSSNQEELEPVIWFDLSSNEKEEDE